MQKTVLLTFMLSIFINFKANAQATPVLRSPYAILMDFNSGKVLYEKNIDTAVPPSSMSKLLTTYYIFEKLKDGTYDLDSEFVVGQEAWKKSQAMTKNSGSTMFLELNEKIKLEDLIRGIIVNSGNDATIVAAEGISGSEENFVKDLNELASRLKLENTSIANSSGWYNKSHLMSTRDLATLSRQLIKDFPEYYHYFAEKEFLYKPHLTGNKDNRNKLLWMMPSSDGLKTGHTSQGGYGLSSSAKKGERRLVAVVNGVKGNGADYARFVDSKALLEWGFRAFSNFVYYNKGDKVLDVPVWFGKKATVAVGVNETIAITAKKNEKQTIELIATYNSPVPAPIKKDTAVGTLSLYVDSEKIGDYPLVTLENTEKTNFFFRIFKNLKEIVLRVVS